MRIGRLFGIDVVVDEQLHHPGSHRAVADDRRRDDGPTESFRHEKRGHLALAQRPVGEVPERPFPATRLVHGEDRHHFVHVVVDDVVHNVGQEGLVGRPRHAPEDLDLTSGEELESFPRGDGLRR